jgi:hypothetical protein
MEPDVEHIDEPHRHRPGSYSEPYVEFDLEWVIPVCECGETLAPRRVVGV